MPYGISQLDRTYRSTLRFDLKCHMGLYAEITALGIQSPRSSYSISVFRSAGIEKETLEEEYYLPSIEIHMLVDEDDNRISHTFQITCGWTGTKFLALVPADPFVEGSEDDNFMYYIVGEIPPKRPNYGLFVCENGEIHTLHWVGDVGPSTQIKAAVGRLMRGEPRELSSTVHGTRHHH